MSEPSPRRAADVEELASVVYEGRIGWIQDVRGRRHLVSGEEAIALAPDALVRLLPKREQAEAALAALVRGEASDVPTAEIAAVLFRSQRSVAWEIARRGAPAPEQPEHFAEHEYAGRFVVERELVVADPCALERAAKPGVVRHAAAPGTWHAWVRHAPGLRDRNVTLFAASDAHLAHATAACVPLGAVAVDSGAIAVADGRLGAQPTPEVDGLYGDHGAVAHTAFGDGLFPVRGVVRGGLAVAVRASLRDAADAYHRPPPDAAYTAALGKRLEAAGEARDYSPKLKLAAGDKVRHAKFGEGLVIAIEGDRAKIAFADDVRLLVHGR